MRLKFTYPSEIDDGHGFVTHFEIIGNISCYSITGEARFDIEDIINLQTNQSLAITELPQDERVKLKSLIEDKIEENKHLAYQEYMEGLHEWQREHEF